MSPTALGPTRARTGYRRHRGILALLAALACLAGCITGELTTSPSSTVTPPAGTVTPGVGTATPSQEQLSAVSWPADGTSAADISGIGVTDGPGATRQVPIASVAKLMTAYVVLQDHPLPAGGSGPDITVEPSEAAAYPSQARDGDSLVAVPPGRRSPSAMRWRRCCCRRPTTWPGYSRGGTPAARPRSQRR
jgi:D-alanyl-D-alanine carboxypeptidase (penicillin-binding protein 5/6)